MMSVLGSVLQMTRPSPLTKRREYEAYLRGPEDVRIGTRTRRRYGEWHESGLTVAPEFRDSYPDSFGIVTDGRFTVQIASAAPAAEASAPGALTSELLLADGNGRILLVDGGFILIAG